MAYKLKKNESISIFTTTPASSPSLSMNNNDHTNSLKKSNPVVDISVTTNGEPEIMPKLETYIKRNKRSVNSPAFALADGLVLMNYGMQAIAQDDIFKCFQPKLRTESTWVKLVSPLYTLGLFCRCILFGFRLSFLLVASLWLFSILPFLILFSNEKWMRIVFSYYCKAFLISLGARIRYHGEKPKLKSPHVFVANHTSFTDYIVLSAHDFPHATVAQKHGGILGFFQEWVLRLNGSLVFERKNKNDREWITNQMKEHVHSPGSTPILIFPEGTCVNNEYTVLFKKGAFELDATICPVAIKYNKKYADPYWHTKVQTFSTHILYLMTRWAFVADVYYLPPTTKGETETPIQFANRVKAHISQTAGVENLYLDGYLKHHKVTKEKQEMLRANPQSRYGAVLLQRLQYGSTSKVGSHARRASTICLSSSESPISNTAVCTSFYSPTSTSILGPTTPPLIFPVSQPTLQTSTSIKNAILKDLKSKPNLSSKPFLDLTRSVVDTWKQATKRESDIPGGEEKIRLENSSWRLWAKQQKQNNKDHNNFKNSLTSETNQEYAKNERPTLIKPPASPFDSVPLTKFDTSPLSYFSPIATSIVQSAPSLSLFQTKSLNNIPHSDVKMNFFRRRINHNEGDRHAVLV